MSYYGGCLVVGYLNDRSGLSHYVLMLMCVELLSFQVSRFVTHVAHVLSRDIGGISWLSHTGGQTLSACNIGLGGTGHWHVLSMVEVMLQEHLVFAQVSWLSYKTSG